MFYVKVKTGEAEFKAVLTYKNVYTICPDCLQEHGVNIFDLWQSSDFDLLGTNVYCPKCSENHSTKQKRKGKKKKK